MNAENSINAEWTEDLSIDVPPIDDQHKALFLHLASLLDAWAGGRGRMEVEKTIKFLEGYVLVHFRTEEQYMIKYRYANRLAHMAQHEEKVRSSSFFVLQLCIRKSC